MNSDTGLDLTLFEKLVEIHAREPDCCARLRALTADLAAFQTHMPALEAWLEKTEEDQPKKQPDTGLPDGFYELYVLAVKLAPLYRLFQSEPRLSQVSDVEQLAILLAMADLRPSSGEVMFVSDDRLMNRLAWLANQTQIPTADELLSADLARVGDLESTQPPIYQALHALAEEPGYAAEIASVEAHLEGRFLSGDGTGPALSPQAQNLLDQVEAADVGDPDRPTADHFLREPRFSEMLAEEILLYSSLQPSLAGVEGLMNVELLKIASAQQKSSFQAQHALKRLSDKEWRYIRRNYSLRRDAVLQFRERREFAKIHALRLTWPDLARLARTDFSDLLALERWLLANKPQQDERKGRIWERYQSYKTEERDRLERFLRLRPHFQSIDPGRLREIFESATSVAAAEAIAPLPEAAAPPAEAVPTDLVQTYEPFVLRVEPADGGFKVKVVESILGEAESSLLQVPWDLSELDAKLSRLQFQATRDLQPSAAPPTRAVAPADHTAEIIQDIGRKMYDFTFPPGPVRELLLGSLTRETRQRFLLDVFAVPELIALPWESIYLPSQRQHLALSPRYSVVRRLQTDPQSRPRTGLGSTLRLLAVMASPVDAPPLNIEEEAAELKSVLAPAMERGQAELVLLEHATYDGLMRALRTFRPHVFHFVGHGVFNPASGVDSGEGAIVLEDEQKRTFFLEADQLSVLLNQSGVSLGVLNGCDTGVSDRNDAMTSTAAALVQAGVPAVIATMRPVVDQAALRFAREFYRAFVDGLLLEQAMVEARKALYIERFDWSVYVLYTGVDELEWLALERRRTVEQAPVRENQ
jgi:hypothetical protein